MAAWASFRADRSREAALAAEDNPCPVAVAACLARDSHQAPFPAAHSLVVASAASLDNRSQAAAASLPVPFLVVVGSLLAAFVACWAVNQIMRSLAANAGVSEDSLPSEQAATYWEVVWAAYYRVEADHDALPPSATRLATRPAGTSVDRAANRRVHNEEKSSPSSAFLSSFSWHSKDPA